MRITVLQQCARGLTRDKADAADERTLERRVESYLRRARTYPVDGTRDRLRAATPRATEPPQ
jgi:hypothetical protein